MCNASPRFDFVLICFAFFAAVKFGNNSPVIRNADTFNDSLSVEGFNLPSFRMSTPMVQQDGNTQIKSKEVSYGSPLRKTFRFAETSATKVSTPCAYQYMFAIIFTDLSFLDLILICV